MVVLTFCQLDFLLGNNDQVGWSQREVALPPKHGYPARQDSGVQFPLW